MSNIIVGAEYIISFPDIAPLYVASSSRTVAPGLVVDQLANESDGTTVLIDDSALPGDYLEFSPPFILTPFPDSLSGLTPTSTFTYVFAGNGSVGGETFKVWEFAPFEFGNLITATTPGSSGASSGFSYLFAESLKDGKLYALFIDLASGHTIQTARWAGPLD